MERADTGFTQFLFVCIVSTISTAIIGSIPDTVLLKQKIKNDTNCGICYLLLYSKNIEINFIIESPTKKLS